MAELGAEGIRSLRGRAFTVVAAGFVVFLYLLSPANLVVIGWFADFEDAISHRVHEVTFGALFTIVLIGIVVQFRSPEDNQSGLYQSLMAVVVLTVVVSASTGFELPVLAYLLPPIALAALHPLARRRPRLDVHSGLLAAGAFAVIPMVSLAITEFEHALDRAQGHESHWGAMAAYAVVVIGLVLLAAARLPGWRITAWSAVGAVVVHSVVSLAFRFDASALADSQALAGLLWAGAYGVVVVRAGRVAAPDSGRLRRSAEDAIVGGVAAGLARRFGLRVGIVRAFFVATLFLGGVIYALLWLLIPGEEPSEGTRRESGARVRRLQWGGLVVATLLVLVMGAGGGFVEPVLLIAAVAVGSLLVRRRRRGGSWWARAVRVAYLGGLVLLIMVAIGVWASNDFFNPPVVPHTVESTARAYCTTCHTAPQAARGAPQLGAEHLLRGLCVDCHSHQAPRPAPTAGGEALWDLGFMSPPEEKP